MKTLEPDLLAKVLDYIICGILAGASYLILKFFILVKCLGRRVFLSQSQTFN